MLVDEPYAAEWAAMAVGVDRGVAGSRSCLRVSSVVAIITA
jgi:hypothetical protein